MHYAPTAGGGRGALIVCGIAGIVSQAPLSSSESVQRMQSALYHRGPDGAGSFQDTHIAMDMRRLAIIDLTGGWQPLYNEDRSLALIANGEIYNHVELRAELEGYGHRFASGSDCETILHLYEQYETECVQYLRGMFAFALWDGWRRRLMLARDRMGEKPLYLHEQNGRLTFASELKALLAAGIVPFELEPHAIDLYFHYQYVPEPLTAIKGIRKLPAAHTLTVDVESWRINEHCYWRMEDAPPLDGDPAELIRAELETVSELVIRADVPVGIALSGGLDSCALAALTSRKYPGQMHAFSVGYPHRPPYDERATARELADQLGLPFHDIELGTEEMVGFFSELVRLRDDPIADISGYGYYAVARRARQEGVPVILQGQGGDELFWGYPWVTQAVRESLRKLSDWKHNRAGPCEQMVFYDIPASFRAAHDEIGGLYTPAFTESLDGRTAFDLFTVPQPWPRVDLRITRLICETYLLENGIAQGDRLSMASSVELRLPLVDYRLVETVIGLRKSQADYKLPPKAWLKAAVADILPDSILNRPKQGFAPPLKTWHRALFSAYGSTLEDGYLVEAGILKLAGARHLAVGHFPDGVIVPLSFKALVLETWCRSMIQHCADGAMGHETRFAARRAVCV